MLPTAGWAASRLGRGHSPPTPHPPPWSIPGLLLFSAYYPLILHFKQCMQMHKDTTEYIKINPGFSQLSRSLTRARASQSILGFVLFSVCKCQGQRTKLSVFFSGSFFLRQDLSLDPERTDWLICLADVPLGS